MHLVARHDRRLGVERIDLEAGDALVVGGDVFELLLRQHVGHDLIAVRRAFLDELTMEERSRVEVTEGDAAAIDLGLSGAELKKIAGEVDRIHHCAGVSYLGVDHATAKHVNAFVPNEATPPNVATESVRSKRSRSMQRRRSPSAIQVRGPQMPKVMPGRAGPSRDRSSLSLLPVVAAVEVVGDDRLTEPFEAAEPQAFAADIFRRAQASGADATDCAGLVEAAGGRVKVVDGDPRLLKVTSLADLETVAGWR